MNLKSLYLPGGALKQQRNAVAESPLVRDWLGRQRERDGWVAAICAAPTALLAHGWLRPEHKIISHPSVHAQFPAGQVLANQRVVVDGKLITGMARRQRAMEFAFEIVRCLRGPDVVAKVNQVAFTPWCEGALFYHPPDQTAAPLLRALPVRLLWSPNACRTVPRLCQARASSGLSSTACS